ncbi:hypothetical protein [Saccharothrix deserti]|uniref:hypothetical protein n=1 Tax=Saccharothrix deserti TaxID=2593674 RepID=UPI00131C68BE|nr:hypothetical protein [Saccharothrix deserti]
MTGRARNTSTGQRWLLVLLGISALVSLLSMAVPALFDHPLVNNGGELQLYLDVVEEGNLPTWWSSALLVTTALAHAVTGASARVAGSRWWPYWFVTAGVLAVLSLDDHTSLHERLDAVGRHVVAFDSFPFYWIVPGLIAGAAVAGAIAVLAANVTPPVRVQLLAGVSVLLVAALGGEVAQGALLVAAETGPLYVLTYHAEELGENIGVLLMLSAATTALTATVREGRIELVYGRPEDAHRLRHDDATIRLDRPRATVHVEVGRHRRAATLNQWR